MTVSFKVYLFHVAYSVLYFLLDST